MTGGSLLANRHTALAPAATPIAAVAAKAAASHQAVVTVADGGRLAHTALSRAVAEHPALANAALSGAAGAGADAWHAWCTVVRDTARTLTAQERALYAVYFPLGAYTCVFMAPVVPASTAAADATGHVAAVASSLKGGTHNRRAEAAVKAAKRASTREAQAAALAAMSPLSMAAARAGVIAGAQGEVVWVAREYDDGQPFEGDDDGAASVIARRHPERLVLGVTEDMADWALPLLAATYVVCHAGKGGPLVCYDTAKVGSVVAWARVWRVSCVRLCASRACDQPCV